MTRELEGELRAVTRLQIATNVFKSFSSLEVVHDVLEIDIRPIILFANFV